MIQPGDAVSLDICVIYDGFVGDNARTVLVGSAHPETARLVKETQTALGLGIQEARVGNRIGDISAAIQKHIQASGFSIVRDFVGHGVGRSMHEEPQIPNFGRPGVGPKLSAGMTLAIEPMVNMGTAAIEYAADGWTALTRDRKPSAHFEHTVLITPSGPEVLTISNL
jgi:methionyl aminopeptidase